VKKFDGYTFLEVFVILALILIFLSIGIPMMIKVYRTYKFKDYAAELQSLANYAKVKAIEKGDYVWICLEENSKFTDVCSGGHCKISIYDVGSCSNVTDCANKKLIKSLLISDSWVELSKSNTFPKGASCLIFDPKGLALTSGDICVSNGKKFYKLILQNGKSLINETTGPGGC